MQPDTGLREGNQVGLEQPGLTEDTEPRAGEDRATMRTGDKL